MSAGAVRGATASGIARERRSLTWTPRASQCGAMARNEPLVLRLPPSMAAAFDLPRLLAEDGRWSWAQGYELLERFAFADYEREFARELLRRVTRSWLYRTNQRCACGDFVVVDMSPPEPRARRAVVIELKLGERLVEGRGLNSPQLARHAEAVEEIVRAGVLEAGCEVQVLRGEPRAVLRFLAG